MAYGRHFFDWPGAESRQKAAIFYAIQPKFRREVLTDQVGRDTM